MKFKKLGEVAIGDTIYLPSRDGTFMEYNVTGTSHSDRCIRIEYIDSEGYFDSINSKRPDADASLVLVKVEVDIIQKLRDHGIPCNLSIEEFCIKNGISLEEYHQGINDK